MLSGALWPEAEQNSTMMLPAFLGQYQAVRVCRSGLGGMDRPERKAGQTRCGTSSIDTTHRPPPMLR